MTHSFNSGYITQSDYAEDEEHLNTKWDIGRNQCSPTNRLCLKKWGETPDDLRYFKKDFMSAMFVREPMDRLVSAWKDKIHTDGIEKNGEKQWFYDKYTKAILRRNMPGRTLPDSVTEAFNTGDFSLNENKKSYVIKDFALHSNSS